MVYIIVEGQNAKKDTRDWEGWLRSALPIPDDEDIIVLPDINPGPFGIFGTAVEPRLEQLKKELEEEGYTDIKLIGFSEGAATVGVLLSELAENPEYLYESITKQLRGAALLECPAGGIEAWWLRDYETEMLYDLPADLVNAGIYMNLIDIWNEKSGMHEETLTGWEYNSYPFSYVPGKGDTATKHNCVYGNDDVAFALWKTFYWDPQVVPGY